MFTRLRRTFCDQKWDFGHISCLALAILFAGQFCLCIYYNLFTLKSHAGYDSSWFYLRAALMWKEKALASPYWAETTGLHFDGAMPMASLLYGLTGNIFVSYGIANIIFLILISGVFCVLLNSLGVGLQATLIGLNLIICPYMTNGFDVANDLGYFSNVISGAGYYAGRVLALLLVMKVIIDMDKKQSPFWIIASLALCFVSGMSVGIFLVIVIVIPTFMYLVEKALIINDIKIFAKKEALYIYGLAASVLAGKIVGRISFSNQTFDETRTWTAIENIWTNFLAVLQGFMKLTGALPVTDASSKNIMSAEGIIYVLPLFILIVCAIAVISAVARAVPFIKKRSADKKLLLPVNIVLGNILIFSLFNARYGAVIFEERYVLVPFIAAIVLTCVFIDGIDKKELISYLFAATFFVSLLGIDAVSCRTYMRSTNDIDRMEEVISCIDETDSELVYIWAESEPALIFGRCLRALDLSRIYKCVNSDGKYDVWADYMYLDNNEDYSGSTILICEKGSDNVPEWIMSKYSLLREYKDCNVYISDVNPIDINTGITSTKSIDYPYSVGMSQTDAYCGENGDFVISSGSDGYKLWGPAGTTKDGAYDFTVYYDMTAGGEDEVFFEIYQDGSEIPIDTVYLSPGSDSAAISAVALEEGHTLEYGLFAAEGAVLSVDRIEITQR